MAKFIKGENLKLTIDGKEIAFIDSQDIEMKLSKFNTDFSSHKKIVGADIELKSYGAEETEQIIFEKLQSIINNLCSKYIQSFKVKPEALTIKVNKIDESDYEGYSIDTYQIIDIDRNIKVGLITALSEIQKDSSIKVEFNSISHY